MTNPITAEQVCAAFVYARLWDGNQVYFTEDPECGVSVSYLVRENGDDVAYSEVADELNGYERKATHFCAAYVPDFF